MHAPSSTPCSTAFKHVAHVGTLASAISVLLSSAEGWVGGCGVVVDGSQWGADGRRCADVAVTPPTVESPTLRVAAPRVPDRASSAALVIIHLPPRPHHTIGPSGAPADPSGPRYTRSSAMDSQPSTASLRTAVSMSLHDVGGGLGGSRVACHRHQFDPHLAKGTTAPRAPQLPSTRPRPRAPPHAPLGRLPARARRGRLRERDAAPAEYARGGHARGGVSQYGHAVARGRLLPGRKGVLKCGSRVRGRNVPSQPPPASAAAA